LNNLTVIVLFNLSVNISENVLTFVQPKVFIEDFVVFYANNLVINQLLNLLFVFFGIPIHVTITCIIK